MIVETTGNVKFACSLRRPVIVGCALKVSDINVVPTILVFSGTVEYHSEGFLVKNLGSWSREVVEFVSKSDISCIEDAPALLTSDDARLSSSLSMNQDAGSSVLSDRAKPGRRSSQSVCSNFRWAHPPDWDLAAFASQAPCQLTPYYSSQTSSLTSLSLLMLIRNAKGVSSQALRYRWLAISTLVCLASSVFTRGTLRSKIRRGPNPSSLLCLAATAGTKALEPFRRLPATARRRMIA